jgi:predicted phosphoribosyltransferase
VPIGAASTCAEFHSIADDCICAITPEPFRAVGLWYEDFSQTGDDEVAELLARARAAADTCRADHHAPESSASSPSAPDPRQEDSP